MTSIYYIYHLLQNRIFVFILVLNVFVQIEGLHEMWRRIEGKRQTTIVNHPKGLALNGYLASAIDFSYIVSYHYKESGRLFCSGLVVSSFWTVSVPNCFHIPTHYYKNRDYKKIRKRDSKKSNFQIYPYGWLSKEQSLTVKPQNYSQEELEDLRDTVTLKPERIVVLTVFDKTYIPCRSEGARTGVQIVIHSGYRIPSHNAEIALLKVSESLISRFEKKIPNISPIDIKESELKICQVVGYGMLKLNRSMYSSPMLSIIDVEVYPPTVCDEISRTYNIVINANPCNYICSYNKKYRYGSPLSQGDSGAPLICDGKVVGLAQWIYSVIPAYLSYGPSQSTPHLYTKLSLYKPWIFENVKGHDEKQFANNIEKLRHLISGRRSSSDRSLSDIKIVTLMYLCMRFAIADILKYKIENAIIFL